MASFIIFECTGYLKLSACSEIRYIKYASCFDHFSISFHFHQKKTSHPEQENGSNEPLKPQPKPRRAQQELHYAELDLTKNPPVAPRKSRGDPVEYAEVQFHK